MTEAPRDFRPRANYIAFVLMAVGTTIYAAFRIVPSAWLVMAGMAWIPIGCLFVLVGLIDLRRSPPPRWKPYLLLFANFPVALLCMLSAVDVMSRAEVYVRNDSGWTLTDMHLIMTGTIQEERTTPIFIYHTDGETIPLPDLPPGRRVARAVRPAGDSTLSLVFRSETGMHKITVHDYLTGSGEYVDVTIGPRGAATINNVRPTFLWPVLP